MMVTKPDGFILQVFGPDKLWKATASDSTIMSAIMKTEWFKNLSKSGDTLVVDRGFRDCVGELTARGFVVETPAFIPT